MKEKLRRVQFLPRTRGNDQVLEKKEGDADSSYAKFVPALGRFVFLVADSSPHDRSIIFKMHCGLYALAFTALLSASQWMAISSAAEDTTTTTMTVPLGSKCDPTRCLIKYSQAWAKTIGLDVPTPSMLHEAQLMGKNDTYGIMCSLYGLHVACLKECDANNPGKAPVGVLMPKFADVCTDMHQDFDDAAPCLSANAAFITKSCEKVENGALAAAIRLSEQLDRMDGSKEININHYCDAINNQIYCELPGVNQFCKFEAYDMLRNLIDAAFVSLRYTFGETPLKKFFPKCDELLRTTANGIPGIVDPSNTTTVATTLVPTTAAAANVTTDQSNLTTIIIIKENNNKTTMARTTTSGGASSTSTTTEAVIQKDAADPYKGDSSPQTTTPSSAIKVSTGQGSTCVMLITSFFFIFHLL